MLGHAGLLQGKWREYYRVDTRPVNHALCYLWENKPQGMCDRMHTVGRRPAISLPQCRLFCCLLSVCPILISDISDHVILVTADPDTQNQCWRVGFASLFILVCVLCWKNSLSIQQTVQAVHQHSSVSVAVSTSSRCLVQIIKA